MYISAVIILPTAVQVVLANVDFELDDSSL